MWTKCVNTVNNNTDNDDGHDGGIYFPFIGQKLLFLVTYISLIFHMKPYFQVFIFWNDKKIVNLANRLQKFFLNM
jgi:hypothetical protein